MFKAFPDMTSTEEELVATDDKVIVRRTLRATHKGEFMGASPSGKKIAFEGVWLAHLREGKIEKQWVYFDALGLMRQIGADPEPA